MFIGLTADTAVARCGGQWRVHSADR